ncbi:MAG TPA: SusD/RagB family nutrient-binding outer membrane lipoprotein [Puia sp.]|nr:SusD/RagB family nutrient-binding outer membrane lipoprotein [Puia sp.]
MTRTFYIIICIAMAGLLFSCTKNFTQKNTDPTQFTSVTPEATIESAVRSLNNQLGTYNTTKFWDISNQVITGSRYDVTDGGLWQTAYVSVLENLKQIEINYGSDTIYNNRVQIARILECYTYSILTGMFGPIPITQANNPNNLSSILYESEDSAYNYILTNLKDATSKIKTTGDKLSYDVVYPGGTVTNWIKFANTLRLKVALRCMRNMGGTAISHIQDVLSNEALTINSEAESAKMAYENVTNNQNPYWLKYIFPNNVYPYNPTATGQAPKMADNWQVFMRSYNDPRMTVFFDSVLLANRYIITDTLTSTLDDSLRVVTYPIPYLGMPLAQTTLSGWLNLVGVTNPIGTLNIKAYSNIAPSIVTNPSRPLMMLGYAETLFLKAEAALLGYGGSLSAEQYYNAGIAANFAFWGIPAAALTTYQNTNGIKFGTSGAGFNNFLGIVNFSIPQTDINKIWIQRWMSYFPDQSFDSWCLERRTRFFVFAPNTNPGGYSSYTAHPTYMDIPGRGSYPNSSSQSIQALNPDGYNSAVQELGTTRADDYDPDQQLKFALPFTVPDWNNANANYDLSYLRKWYGMTIQSLKAAAASGGFPYAVTLTYHP